MGVEYEPILITGIDAIAQVLGISSSTVENEALKRPDFPVWRFSPRGQWLTTREALEEWARRLIAAKQLNNCHGAVLSER